MDGVPVNNVGGGSLHDDGWWAALRPEVAPHAPGIPTRLSDVVQRANARLHDHDDGTEGNEATATARFMHAVKEDHAQLERYRHRYHSERPSMPSLGRAAVEQVGLQMMVAVRVMRWARDAGFYDVARVCSRMIRHLYGAEIHWNTELAPGVCLIHGVGLVLGHEARVDHGCMLFHNVTLGEGLDPVTKQRGTPHLEHHVHVGPGCTLLGPITVGAHSKIMAGCVLTTSVPPDSLVTPAAVQVQPRHPPA